VGGGYAVGVELSRDLAQALPGFARAADPLYHGGLLHRQGRTWAEIGALVGQRSLKVTSDTYTHVLVDGRELDYAALLEPL
jgi:hypothetical protein